MTSQIITLLTDFGLTDHYVGAMKGVMLGICPNAQLIDISHGVTPYAIAESAYTLAQAWQCFPAGTIHLVVVDPGVGSERRPIVVEAGGHLFVGPDNGVFDMVYGAAGEVVVREITVARYFRHPVSRTFHGRDIFSPVAAHLATGVGPAEVGHTIEDYQRLHLAKPIQTGPGQWTGRILKIDHYGNIITNLRSDEWPPHTPLQVRVGGKTIEHWADNYAQMAPGQAFFVAGSSGYVEISIREASAGYWADSPSDAEIFIFRLSS